MVVYCAVEKNVILSNGCQNVTTILFVNCSLFSLGLVFMLDLLLIETMNPRFANMIQENVYQWHNILEMKTSLKVKNRFWLFPGDLPMEMPCISTVDHPRNWRRRSTASLEPKFLHKLTTIPIRVILRVLRLE